MISTESAFNELGIDAVTGVELMDWMGISPVDLGDPSRFSKMHQIINYFKQFPPETQRYLIRRATNGKNVDKLQHVWEYAGLLQRKDNIQKNIDKLKSESSAIGDEADTAILAGLAQREGFLKDDLKSVTEEISIYEK